MDKKEMKLDSKKFIKNKESFIRGYLSHISKKGYSYHTIQNREWILREFLKDFNIPNKDSVYKFIEKERWNKNSKAQIVYVLKAFGKWITKEHNINFDIPSSLQQPKKVPVYLSNNEVMKLRNACKKIRDKAIIDMLLFTGIKPSELYNLDINDVNLKSGRMNIAEKGKNKREIPIDKALKNTLQSYMQWREVHTHSNALFISNRGTRLSKIEIYAIIKRRAKNAGIDKKTSPHTLRHTFAVLLMQNKADILTMQKLLGHKNPKTTSIYAHLSEQAKKSN
ncbi:MAG: tyrosine-type recombinase/integrase [Caldisericota bacterium]|nr:tyrosine-type recombinase/integrase [Caldisericota bacterium]